MSEAVKKFPAFTFDTSIGEVDADWLAGNAETAASRDSRVRALLEWIWDRRETFVSITTHEVTIRDMLKLVEHPNPNFKVGMGQILPILVRGDRGRGNGPVHVFKREPVSQCGACGSA